MKSQVYKYENVRLVHNVSDAHSAYCFNKSYTTSLYAYNRIPPTNNIVTYYILTVKFCFRIIEMLFCSS